MLGCNAQCMLDQSAHPRHYMLWHSTYQCMLHPRACCMPNSTRQVMAHTAVQCTMHAGVRCTLGYIVQRTPRHNAPRVRCLMHAGVQCMPRRDARCMSGCDACCDAYLAAVPSVHRLCLTPPRGVCRRARVPRSRRWRRWRLCARSWSCSGRRCRMSPRSVSFPPLPASKCCETPQFPLGDLGCPPTPRRQCWQTTPSTHRPPQCPPRVPSRPALPPPPFTPLCAAATSSCR